MENPEPSWLPDFVSLAGWETRELERNGIRYEVDQGALDGGVLIIRAWPVIDGIEIATVTTFPDLYPFFRFLVAAPDLSLAKHQVPGTKELCLIGRPSVNWNSDHSLASYLLDRLPIVLKAARTTDVDLSDSLEDLQGEPWSDYARYEPGGIVLIDSSWELSGKGGRLDFNLMLSAPGTLRAVISRAESDGGVSTARDEVARLGGTSCTGAWVRYEHPPDLSSPEALFKSARKRVTTKSLPAFTLPDGRRAHMIAVLFPEEVQRRVFGDGWIFVVKLDNTNGRASEYSFVRAGRAGVVDLSSRVPTSIDLADKSILMIGLGALGGPMFLSLAQAGIGSVHAFDGDHLDPGTLHRSALGLQYAGLMKTEAYGRFVGGNYPDTAAVMYSYQLGSVRPAGSGPTEWEVLEKILAEVDLIVDATGEFGVNHLSSWLSSKYQVPCVQVSTTVGVWSAIISRFDPTRSRGCWVCLRKSHEAVDDGGDGIPFPPGDPDGMMQPVACGDRTYVGSGDDIAYVAANATRVCLNLLSGVGTDDWDVAIGRLAADGIRFDFPEWSLHRLESDPTCGCQPSGEGS